VFLSPCSVPSYGGIWWGIADISILCNRWNKKRCASEFRSSRPAEQWSGRTDGDGQESYLKWPRRSLRDSLSWRSNWVPPPMGNVWCWVTCSYTRSTVPCGAGASNIMHMLHMRWENNDQMHQTATLALVINFNATNKTLELFWECNFAFQMGATWGIMPPIPGPLQIQSAKIANLTIFKFVLCSVASAGARISTHSPD